MWRSTFSEAEDQILNLLISSSSEEYSFPYLLFHSKKDSIWGRNENDAETTFVKKAVKAIPQTVDRLVSVSTRGNMFLLMIVDFKSFEAGGNYFQ